MLTNPSLAMPSPLVSLLIAALGLLAVQLAGRRTPLLTAITLATLLTLPLLGFLPKIHLQLPAEAPAALQASTSVYVKIYLLGLVLFSGQLLFDFLSFQRWKKASFALEDAPLLEEVLNESQEQLGIIQEVNIRFHPHLESPVAGGLRKPTVYLPECARDWSRETAKAVLLHELGHHVRRDLWASFAARLACLVHWFNPLAWILRRRLLTQCEFACDARVLETGIDAKSYAHTLCDLAMPKSCRTPALAMAMATKSTLRDRVENLLSPRRPVTFLPIAATLLLTLGTALALSTLRPAIEETFGHGTDYQKAEVELRLTANPFPGN